MKTKYISALTAIVMAVTAFCATYALRSSAATDSPRSSAAPAANVTTTTTAVLPTEVLDAVVEAPPAPTEPSVSVPHTQNKPAAGSPTTTTTVPAAAGKAPKAQSSAPAAKAGTPAAVSTQDKVLSIARGEIGKTGAYSEGGFWCAKFTSWVYSGAGVKTPTVADKADLGPMDLFNDAKRRGLVKDTPTVGGLVYIDLFNGAAGEGYINHVGIIESVNGNTITTIERAPTTANGDKVIRLVRHIDDTESPNGRVLNFSRLP